MRSKWVSWREAQKINKKKVEDIEKSFFFHKIVSFLYSFCSSPHFFSSYRGWNCSAIQFYMLHFPEGSHVLLSKFCIFWKRTYKIFTSYIKTREEVTYICNLFWTSEFLMRASSSNTKKCMYKKEITM